jgi:DNA repair protein RecO (recombination protein O)
MTETAVLGMVLQATPIGDYDKRLVILTREKGKITAFAKGARKPNSAFLACSQPFSFGEFTLYEGRSSYNLMNADITNYFEDLRKDLEAAYYGFYFCELADYFTHENEDGALALKLLYQSLRALSQESIGKPLVRSVYELKLLVINGVGPQVYQCVKCGKNDEIHYFSPQSGGILCSDCSKSLGKNKKLSDAAIFTMQYITASAIEKLYNFTVKKEVLDELKYCLDNYRGFYIDKKIKSLELLEKLILT